MSNLAEAYKNFDAFSNNPMVGRGMILGINSPGTHASQTYWMEARSVNSKNRVFVRDSGTTIKTDYHDASIADHSQDEFVLYHAMAEYDDEHFVSNGSHTDTALNGAKGTLFNGDHMRRLTLEESLADTTYEQDKPNFTTRILGSTYATENFVSNSFSQIYRGENNETIRRLTNKILHPDFKGFGHTIHTYTGHGDPLPGFTDEPYILPVEGKTAQDIIAFHWDALDNEFRVGMIVKTIELKTGLVEVATVDIYNPQIRTI